MPAMPDSLWQAVVLLLVWGLPYSLVLYPALLLVPAFLIRAVVVRSRKSVPEEYPMQYERGLRWRRWTVASLVPWVPVMMWVLYDLATNKSY
jgi:hypothetical protein